MSSVAGNGDFGGHPWMNLVVGTFAGRYQAMDQISQKELKQLCKRLNAASKRLSATSEKCEAISVDVLDMVGKERLLEGVAAIERLSQILTLCTDLTESHKEAE